MDNKLKNIFSLYSELSENKKIISELLVSPAETSYSTMKFSNKAKQDKINKPLLDDIETAAKAAGVNVTIDYAKTGHGKFAKSGNISRHWANNAVDIDFIDGKAVSPANKEIVNKFVNALISMGYNKNAEGSSHPKAVLTFGFPGHDDHVHVSNTTDNTSSIGSDYDAESSDTESSDTESSDSNETSSGSTTSSIGDIFLDKFIDKMSSIVGIKESDKKSRNKKRIIKDVDRIKTLLK
jgi:hypothetical protein